MWGQTQKKIETSSQLHHMQIVFLPRPRLSSSARSFSSRPHEQVHVRAVMGRPSRDQPSHRKNLWLAKTSLPKNPRSAGRSLRGKPFGGKSLRGWAFWRPSVFDRSHHHKGFEFLPSLCCMWRPAVSRVLLWHRARCCVLVLLLLCIVCCSLAFWPGLS